MCYGFRSILLQTCHHNQSTRWSRLRKTIIFSFSSRVFYKTSCAPQMWVIGSLHMDHKNVRGEYKLYIALTNRLSWILDEVTQFSEWTTQTVRLHRLGKSSFFVLCTAISNLKSQFVIHSSEQPTNTTERCFTDKTSELRTLKCRSSVIGMPPGSGHYTVSCEPRELCSVTEEWPWVLRRSVVRGLFHCGHQTKSVAAPPTQVPAQLSTVLVPSLFSRWSPVCASSLDWVALNSWWHHIVTWCLCSGPNLRTHRHK